METNEQAASASQPAATTTPASSDAATQELERHPSFLGYRPGIEASAEEPEPSADVVTTKDESETETPEAAASGAEEDPNWLSDEQQKVFPDDVIARYAKRYCYTQEQVAESAEREEVEVMIDLIQRICVPWEKKPVRTKTKAASFEAKIMWLRTRI